MSCSAPTVVVGGVLMSTSDFVNAQDLIATSGDGGDPTADGYDENIANGNNEAATAGVQVPPPTQTTPPPPIPEEAEESNDEPPPAKEGEPVTCVEWVDDYDFQLSANYKVRDFSIGALYPHQCIDLPSITKSQRVCNLQALSTNVAEPLRAKFGTFRINSGLRNTNSSSSGMSQHVTGSAFDAQFPGWTYDRYWNAAQWIKDNIPYDQFIFEHSSGGGVAWFHLSYNQGGNRSPTSSTKVMTMYRNNYSSGLKKFA